MIADTNSGSGEGPKSQRQQLLSNEDIPLLPNHGLSSPPSKTLNASADIFAQCWPNLEIIS